MPLNIQCERIFLRHLIRPLRHVRTAAVLKRDPAEDLTARKLKHNPEKFQPKLDKKSHNPKGIFS